MTAYATGSVAIHGAEYPIAAEASVLDFVVEFHDLYGRLPTYREVRIELVDRSLLVAYRHVCTRLKEKGSLMNRRERFLASTPADRLSWPRSRSTPWWW